MRYYNLKEFKSQILSPQVFKSTKRDLPYLVRYSEIPYLKTYARESQDQSYYHNIKSMARLKIAQEL